MRELLFKINGNKKITASLNIISHASALLCVAIYAVAVCLAFTAELKVLVGILFWAGAPFVLVSMIRRIINAPRPYEVYEFYEDTKGKRAGQSFPSRHVFSAFVIATLTLCVSVPLGIVAFALGISLAVSRVLLGLHFVRDVTAGAIIGVLFGLLGILIILI